MRRGRKLTGRIDPAGCSLGDDDRQSDLRRSREAGRIRQGAGVAMTGGGSCRPLLPMLGHAYDRQRSVGRRIGREVYPLLRDGRSDRPVREAERRHRQRIERDDPDIGAAVAEPRQHAGR